MNNRVGTIILVLISVGLIAGLIWTKKQSSDQRAKDGDTITYYSNQVVQTTATLDQQRQVNISLESDLKKGKEAYNDLTNAFTEVSVNLEKSEASLKSSQEEIQRRDTRIADLETQNQALDQRATDLSTSITNLTSQIDETKRKLSASEGDKAFLEKELQRLITEKAELERQFNDLAVLRAQVSKLKAELNISRRLEWIRQGLFARNDERGAQQLMQKVAASTNRPSKELPTYDLNVEVSADGTVKVIPAMPPQPAGAATNASSAQ